MSEENVNEPLVGTAKVELLIAMYLRWSKTLKSNDVRNGASAIANVPSLKSRVSGPAPMSPRP